MGRRDDRSDAIVHVNSPPVWRFGFRNRTRTSATGVSDCKRRFPEIEAERKEAPGCHKRFVCDNVFICISNKVNVYAQLQDSNIILCVCVWFGVDKNNLQNEGISQPLASFLFEKLYYSPFSVVWHFEVISCHVNCKLWLTKSILFQLTRTCNCVVVSCALAFRKELKE